jgi:hypothetical protein
MATLFTASSAENSKNSSLFNRFDKNIFDMLNFLGI